MMSLMNNTTGKITAKTVAKTVDKTTAKTAAWKGIVASMVMAGVTAVGTETAVGADYSYKIGVAAAVNDTALNAGLDTGGIVVTAWTTAISPNTLFVTLTGNQTANTAITTTGGGNGGFLFNGVTTNGNLIGLTDLTIDGTNGKNNYSLTNDTRVAPGSDLKCRVLDIRNLGATGKITLKNLTLAGANYSPLAATTQFVYGGNAVQDFKTLSLNNLAISNNVAKVTTVAASPAAGAGGGGLFVAPIDTTAGTKFTMADTLISKNTASLLDTSVVANAGGRFTVFGGGLYLSRLETINIKDSVISDNTAQADKAMAFGGGLMIFNDNADGDTKYTITDTIFIGNKAIGTDARGGAVAITNDSVATPTAGTFTTKFIDTSFKYNSASGTTVAAGGAIFTDQNIGIEAKNSNVLFLYNYANGFANDIHLDQGAAATAPTLTLNAAKNRTIWLGGGITGNGDIKINTEADSLGSIYLGYAEFGEMTVDNGTLMICTSATSAATAPLQGIDPATSTLKFDNKAKLALLVDIDAYKINVGETETDSRYITNITVPANIQLAKEQIVSTNPLFSVDYTANSHEFKLKHEYAAKALPQLSQEVAGALNEYQGNNLFLDFALYNAGDANNNPRVAEQVESGFNMTGRAGTMRQTLSAKNLVVGASRNIAPQYVVSAGGNYRLPPNHPSNYQHDYSSGDYAPNYNPQYNTTQETSPMAKPEQLSPPPSPKEMMPPAQGKPYPFPALPSATRGQVPHSIMGQSAFWCVPLYGHDSGNNVKSGNVGFDYAADQYGLAFGMETIAGGARVGIASAIGWSNVTAKSANITTTDAADFGSIYGFFHAPLGAVDVTANLGWLGATHYVRQEVAGARMNASVDTGALFGAFGIERTYHCGGLRVTPSVGIECNWLYQDEYRTLWGAANAFHADKSTAATCALPMGVRMNRDIMCGAGIFTPEIRARYIPNVGANDLTYTNTTSYNYGSSSTPIRAAMKSPITDAHAGDLGLGLTWKYKFFELGADYNVLVSQRFVEQNINGVARWKF